MPPEVKPLRFDSKPYWRCGYCYNAIVVNKDDRKPCLCKWCLCAVDWSVLDEEDG